MHRYGLWRSNAIPSLGSERGSQTPERAGSWRSWNLSHATRLAPHAAFPDTRARSLNKWEHIQKRARLQSSGLRLHANTGRLGLCPFFGDVSELWQLSVSELFSPQPPVTRAVRQTRAVTTKRQQSENASNPS